MCGVGEPRIAIFDAINIYAHLCHCSPILITCGVRFYLFTVIDFLLLRGYFLHLHCQILMLVMVTLLCKSCAKWVLESSLLCSLFILKLVVIPTLEWILPSQCSEISSQGPCLSNSVLKLYSVLRIGLIQLFYVSIQCISCSLLCNFFFFLISFLLLFWDSWMFL